MEKTKAPAGKARSKSAKITVREMALVGWLAADPHNRFAMVSDRSVACYEKLDPDADGKRPVNKLAEHHIDEASASLRRWFGGEIKFSEEPIADAGYVVSYSMLGRVFRKDDRHLFAEAVKDIKIQGQWNLSSHYIGVTEQGVQWWETEGRAAHAAALAALSAAAEKARAAERRAVFGWVASFSQAVPDEFAELSREGYQLPLPKLQGLRPMLTAIITRETPTRYYVRDARTIKSGDAITHSLVVQQHGKEYFIEKERLILDNASDADVAALRSFDDEQQRDHYERCRRAADEILPILRRHAALAKQNAAEHQDLMRELLERLSRK